MCSCEPAGGGSGREEYEAHRSPSKSPAQLPTQHNAVAAAEQRVHAIQSASAQPAALQFQFLGGSRPKGNAQHSARAPAASGARSNASSPAAADPAGTSPEDSPLPTRVVATRVMASSSRGASTSHALHHASNSDSPSTPRGQHGGHAEEYASPSAMPPPGSFREPVRPTAQASKPPLSSGKRAVGAPANPPYNPPFKRPNRG